jgi:hypothetical protein
MACGKCKCTYPDGSRYEGECKEGKPYGRGKFIDEKGYVYDGEWNDRIGDGNCSVTAPDGKVVKCVWKNGKLCKRNILLEALPTVGKILCRTCGGAALTAGWIAVCVVAPTFIITLPIYLHCMFMVTGLYERMFPGVY